MFKEKETLRIAYLKKLNFSLGLIISFLSIFIVDFSFIFFLIGYLLGIFLIFISTFMGIEKFNKNALGGITSSVGLILIMLGIFAPLGINPNFYYVLIIGTFFMLSGITLESIVKKKSA